MSNQNEDEVREYELNDIVEKDMFHWFRHKWSKWANKFIPKGSYCEYQERKCFTCKKIERRCL